jgi:hypothetical protein
MPMCQFWLDNWQFIVSTCLAVAGGIWAVHTYLEKRTDELSWKRTEFLFAQAQYLETDAEIARVVRILEKRDERWSVDGLLDLTRTPASEQLKLLQALDKALNLFDRLAYSVFTAKTLTLEELTIFGWYLDLISDDQMLRKYCEEKGFKDVIRLAEELRELEGK